MLVNREVILAKIETTYGTDSVPVEATDAMLVENVSWSNEGLRMNERPAVRQNIGMLQHVFGGRLMSVSFDVEMKGSGGAVDAPPEFGPLLRACGFGETINAASDVQYAPVSTGHESITLYYFQDGIRYTLLGCRGNVSFNLETGAIGKMSFTFSGHIGTITDVALPSSPAYDSHVPPPLINVPFTIGGFSAVINALTFDLSNTIATPPDISATDGYAEIQITQRDVQGSYDPESELIADDDPHGDLTSDAAQAITTGVIGTGTGERFQVDMPAVYYRDISPGDRDGIRTYDLPFGCAENTGDDEVTLTFT
jgi:hypothetical protein